MQTPKPRSVARGSEDSDTIPEVPPLLTGATISSRGHYGCLAMEPVSAGKHRETYSVPACGGSPAPPDRGVPPPKAAGSPECFSCHMTKKANPVTLTSYSSPKGRYHNPLNPFEPFEPSEPSCAPLYKIFPTAPSPLCYNMRSDYGTAFLFFTYIIFTIIFLLISKT